MAAHYETSRMAPSLLLLLFFFYWAQKMEARGVWCKAATVDRPRLIPARKTIYLSHMKILIEKMRRRIPNKIYLLFVGCTVKGQDARTLEAVECGDGGDAPLVPLVAFHASKDADVEEKHNTAAILREQRPRTGEETSKQGTVFMSNAADLQKDNNIQNRLIL